MSLIKHDMGTGPPHVIPVEFVCMKLGRLGFRMIGYHNGKNFESINENDRSIGDAATFVETGYLFQK